MVSEGENEEEDGREKTEDEPGYESTRCCRTFSRLKSLEFSKRPSNIRE